MIAEEIKKIRDIVENVLDSDCLKDNSLLLEEHHKLKEIVSEQDSEIKNLREQNIHLSRKLLELTNEYQMVMESLKR